MYQTLKKVFEHIDKHFEVCSFTNVEIVALVFQKIY